MLQNDSLLDLLNRGDIAKVDKILICLAVEPGGARPIKEVRKLAVDGGLRQAKDWNLSDMLKKAWGLVALTADGWRLTTDGWDRVSKLTGPLMGSPIPRVASSLRAHLTNVSDKDTLAFIDEAIKCLETHLYRAAVVLSWVGALSVLQHRVIKHHLAAFNAEALRRDTKWRSARNADDLSRMKEHDFLQVLESISVVGKSVKQELEHALKLRNGCGHPNSLKVAEQTASAHVELLVLNVFSAY